MGPREPHAVRTPPVVRRPGRQACGVTSQSHHTRGARKSPVPRDGWTLEARGEPQNVNCLRTVYTAAGTLPFSCKI